MKNALKKLFSLISALISKLWGYINRTKAAVLACVFSFLLIFGGIYITSIRNITIKNIRWNLSKSISQLNEIGLDISYDNISFNSLFFFPTAEIDNFQIYNLKGNTHASLKLNKIKVYSGILFPSSIQFKSVSGGEFTLNNNKYQLSSDETFLELNTKNSKFDELVIHAENVLLKDFADIKKVAFLLEATNHKNENAAVALPEYKSFFEIKDVKINGLVNYPLTSELKSLYIKSEILGKFPSEQHFLTSLETWLKNGGYIEVPNLVVQWAPLTLVGRGDIHFNEKFSPFIKFNTSSKGLLRLLEDLRKNEFLDSKNVFVANIVLSNKAIKIKPDDKEFTISTPIYYSDKILKIEEMVIKDFSK